MNKYKNVCYYFNSFQLVMFERRQKQIIEMQQSKIEAGIESSFFFCFLILFNVQTIDYNTHWIQNHRAQSGFFLPFKWVRELLAECWKYIYNNSAEHLYNGIQMKVLYNLLVALAIFYMDINSPCVAISKNSVAHMNQTLNANKKKNI